MQTILYDPSPSIQDSARSSDHSKLTYPQLFSPFRVFPPNQLPPNYPIVQQYHSFRIILRCSSATTAYSAMPKPKHLVAQKNCTAAKAAQFWRLTCALNQRFGQVIKKTSLPDISICQGRVNVPALPPCFMDLSMLSVKYYHIPGN